MAKDSSVSFIIYNHMLIVNLKMNYYTAGMTVIKQ